MTRNRLPVVAAIPNYNMGTDLHELLPRLKEQNYDEIYVIDDCSNDNSREIVEACGDVTFLPSECNRGAGATRNRITNALDGLGHRALIHFIDADTKPISHNNPEAIRETVTEETGFVAGLVNDSGTGLQYMFNYGPRFGLAKSTTGSLQVYLASLLTKNPERAEALRRRHDRFLRDWPNPFAVPVPRQIFWGTEANLIIDSKIFKNVQGFNEKLRQEEIQDLAVKLSRLGLKRWFTPEVALTHKATQVREGSHMLRVYRAELQLIGIYGLRNWLMPGGKLYPDL